MPTPAALPFEFGKDSTNVKGGALVDAATGSPKWWRGRGQSGDYAGAEVLVYDTAGNPLLVTANPGYVKTNDGDLAEIGATTAAVAAAGATGSVSAKLRRLTQGVEDLKTLIVLGAGSAVIGKVSVDQTTPGTTNNVAAGGITTAILPTITASASPAYTAGDNVGGKLTLASAVRVSGGTGIIQSIVLADTTKQSAATDIFFFSSDPSGSTFTDNAAQDIVAADCPKLIGVVSILATDYAAVTSRSVAVKPGIGLAFKASGSTSIYACLVTRGTPTYSATAGTLTLAVTILED